MDAINCWEFMKCGLEPGGEHVEARGVCPAATKIKLNGMNRGLNAGRICWFVEGTLCNGAIQGTVAQKFESCHDCEFYRLVQKK